MDIEDLFPPLSGLVVEAWLGAPLDPSNPLLARVLTERYGNFFDPGALRLTHPALATATPAGTPVWGSHVLSVVPVTSAATAVLHEAASGLDATTGFEVHQAAPRAQVRVVIAEDVPGHVDPDARLQALRELMWTLDEALDPLLWLVPSSLSVGPLGERPGSLYDGLLRQRRFPSATATHAWVVDTLGGEPLGIPDIECAFCGIEPHRVEDLVVTLVEQFVDGTTSVSPGDPVILGGGDDVEPILMAADVGVSSVAPLRRLLLLRPERGHAAE